MFSEKLSSLKTKIEELLGEKPPERTELNEILSCRCRGLNLEQASRLILASSDPSLQKQIIKSAIACRKQNWHEQLFLVPPLYVSNGDPKHGCLDYCLYCSWHHDNIPREKLHSRMTNREVYQQTKMLLDMGYGDIELVAATDLFLLKADNCANYIGAAKHAGAKNIGINFFPLKSADDYEQLKKAGCTFVILWQETYQPKIYQMMHPRGPKSNMEYRLDAHDRAIEGGIKTVGLAFLGGLADWRYETLATIAHAQYLKETYGANIIFGMPRWKQGFGVKIEPVEYSDQMYKFVGALYSLAMPDSLPWFSTREKFELSAKAAQGGGCLFTLDCSTEVGGYSRSGGIAQFPVYSRSFKQGVEWLKNLGFKPRLHLPF